MLRSALSRKSVGHGLCRHTRSAFVATSEPAICFARRQERTTPASRRAAAASLTVRAIFVRKAGLRLPRGVVDSKSIALSSSTRLYSSRMIQHGKSRPARRHSIWLMARESRSVSESCDVTGKRNTTPGVADVRTTTQTGRALRPDSSLAVAWRFHSRRNGRSARAQALSVSIMSSRPSISSSWTCWGASMSPYAAVWERPMSLP
jgi:hypothetical protein